MKKAIGYMLILVFASIPMFFTEAQAFSRKKTPTTIKVVVRTPDGSVGSYGCPGTKVKVYVWSEGYRDGYLYPSGSHSINSLSTTSSVSFQYSTSMWRYMWERDMQVVTVVLYNGNSSVPCAVLSYTAHDLNSGTSSDRTNYLFVTLPDHCCYQG